MNKELGTAGAKKLRARLADIDAADNVRELVAGRPHPLTGNRSGQFALDLHKGCRLVFEPLELPPPELDAGGIDWSRVRRVRIIEIGDYHD